jgi:hypothetical protein
MPGLLGKKFPAPVGEWRDAMPAENPEKENVN